MGLCNQLYDFSTAIEISCKENHDLTFQGFEVDIVQKIQRPLTDILDLDSTNLNLNCTKIIPYSDTSQYKDVHNYNIYRSFVAVGSRWSDEYLQRLVLSKTLEWKPNEVKILPTIYYGVHLRLETDWIIFMSHGGYNAEDWINNLKNNFTQADIIQKKFFDNPDVPNRIDCLLKNYKQLMSKHFTNKDIPVVIATSLGKGHHLNRPMEWALIDIMTYLRKHGHFVVTGIGSTRYRDMNAAAELKIMVDSAYFIGGWWSSFSRAVMAIRKFRNLESSDLPNHGQGCS